MDFILTVKDYLIKEAKMEERNDIIENEANITHVRFNKEKHSYSFKINGETIFFKVPLWKDVTINEKYEVSRFGEVRRKGKIETLKSYKSPYAKVCLGHPSLIYHVHKLVVTAFIGVDDNIIRNQVNHNDFNVENNELFNLHWVTRKENIEHYRVLHNLNYNYEGDVGKKINSNYGDLYVVGYDKSKYKLIVEFKNTGNQKEMKPCELYTMRPTDNYYEIISPAGEVIPTRSLNILKKEFGIQGARFSEILSGIRSNYKGWTVRRTKNNKIIKGGK